MESMSTEYQKFQSNWKKWSKIVLDRGRKPLDITHTVQVVQVHILNFNYLIYKCLQRKEIFKKNNLRPSLYKPSLYLQPHGELMVQEDQPRIFPKSVTETVQGVYLKKLKSNVF